MYRPPFLHFFFLNYLCHKLCRVSQPVGSKERKSYRTVGGARTHISTYRMALLPTTGLTGSIFWVNVYHTQFKKKKKKPAAPDGPTRMPLALPVELQPHGPHHQPRPRGAAWRPNLQPPCPSSGYRGSEPASSSIPVSSSNLLNLVLVAP